MSQRTIKNYTNEDVIIGDLGDVVIPANGAIDLGGDEQRMMELASSEELLLLLGQGESKYQVFDGVRDLSTAQGIDLIRKISRPTEIDTLGRWVVRADSRKVSWDVVFQGAGDDIVNGKSGGGNGFRWDFSAPSEDNRWDNENAPEGYKQQVIDWQFCDWVYIKEGTIYFYDIPKGSYINFEVVAPPGTFGLTKVLDNNLQVTKQMWPTGEDWWTILHWVIDYPMEGSSPMGDELNTESAAENPSPSFFVWRAIITVPEVEGWEDAHGHWSLEVYRTSMGPAGAYKTTPSKIVTWPPGV